MSDKPYFFNSLAEFYDNNFKLKILDPKNNMNNNTIGFLIGLFEDYVYSKIL